MEIKNKQIIHPSPMGSVIPRSETAAVVIDIQRFVMQPDAHPPRPEFYTRMARVVMPTVARTLPRLRGAGVEIIYTVMESLTDDGRDRSLDYKLSGFDLPPGRGHGDIPSSIAPQGDEMILRKSSASLFNSTSFDYHLHNMGIRQVIVMGVLTDQCVEQTMRAGSSLGYEMICLNDGCAANTDARHDAALQRIARIGRVTTEQNLLHMLGAEG